MTEATRAKLPAHLAPFVVDQNYARYTPEDQATWRFVMRQLKGYLKEHAHPFYVEGLAKTGITLDEIPRITTVDEKLGAFGWGAVPVSGFIPPAAFMEFQSIGVLPIASDMRTREHWLYTPAPDIVHEAAGHAPLLPLEGYSEYLRRYGEVARHCIIAQDDLEQYEAIRALSDLKEDPRTTPELLAAAERRLTEANARTTSLSEAALLSRMNWWTAEYGLIGSLEAPKLFGAGLLSSVGEARTCLEPRVKKLELTADCVNYGYDITEMQPMLFVTPDFARLSEVLDEVASRLAYRRGGRHGLDEAIRARTVNTVQFDSGLQLSGRLESYLTDGDRPAFLKLSGPCQLSLGYREIEAQSRARHQHGFSCPVGPLKSPFDPGARRLEFTSGVVVEGRVTHVESRDGRPLFATFVDCTVTRGSERLFEPAWGEYDCVLAEAIPSVFGGPADRTAFGEVESFAKTTVPPKAYAAGERARFALYEDIRRGHDPDDCLARFLKLPGDEWLMGLELEARFGSTVPAELARRLDPATRDDQTVRLALRLGRFKP